ncbi:MAG: hypothetical protein R3B72_00050 [Polyangiaceae bacterium]
MIDTGSARLRVEAIASAPLSWPHLVEAIVAAKDDHDDRVAVAAYRRMLALSPAEAKEAQEGLRRIAKKGGLAADDAKAALVEARDDEVLPLLAADRAAKSPLSRADLAERYAALGQLSLALPFVADPDARVRARAACAIVAED